MSNTTKKDVLIFSIIAIGFVFGCVFAVGLFYISSFEQESLVKTNIVDNYLRSPPISIELPEDDFITLDEVEIVSDLKSLAIPSSSKLVWECSEWRESNFGGRVKNCNWK